MAQEAKSSFVIYCDYKKHLALLTDEERGKLLMALLEYSENRTAPALDGAALMAFSFIAGQMDRDAEKYAEICRKRSEAGKQGGRRARAKKADDTAPEPDEKAKQANDFSDKQSEANKADNENDNDNVNESDINTPHNPPGGLPAGAQAKRFETFWLQYPKKVGKAAAMKAWKRVKPDAALYDRIMQAVEKSKQSEQWTREGGRYIPNPATWINQGRWDDVLMPFVQPNNTGKQKGANNHGDAGRDIERQERQEGAGGPTALSGFRMAEG